MTPLFKKLNFKDHPSILVLNGPESFHPEAEAMAPYTQVHLQYTPGTPCTFALVFATQKSQIDEAIATLAPHMEGDVVLWFAYPKGTSKKYKCDFNRDTGWDTVGGHGFEPVRMVAIDADWSALRFRRVEYIKKLTRSKAMTLTKQGKMRTSGK